MSSVLPLHQSHSGKQSFPLRLFAAAFVIGLLTSVFSGWQLWQMHVRFEKMSAKHIDLAKDIGRIMLFDEILTMSARMAAATGDTAYEKRYDQADPQLTAYIDDVRADLPQPEIAQFIVETDAANVALVKMERQAFALTHQGNLKEATTLLRSEEYMRLKNIYSVGMEKTVDAANGLIERDTQQLLFQSVGLAVTNAIGVLVLLAAWLFAARSARSWNAERREAEDVLRKAHDELEIQVKQRTANLSSTNEELVREISVRTAAEEKIHRMTQLYAALSQCNQAIVRCASEEELFRQICSIAMQTDGIKMAWIGLVEESGRRVKPVASFGVGIEYLDGIRISTDAGDPNGHGPTSTCIRENRPFWCQNFLSDPATKPWHERASRFGWGASASLPLLRNGVVIGAFTLYADAANAFDEDARNLLVEMATDISFALDNFLREAVRSRVEMQSEVERGVLELLAKDETLPTLLTHLALSYETMYPGMKCSVLLLDADGRHLRHGAAPSLPDAYCQAIDGVEIGPTVGSCGTSAYTRKTVIVADIASDPLWQNYKELALAHGLFACWSVPILSTQGRTLGTFALYHGAPRSPLPAELAAIERGANLASLAIERKQSEERIQQLAHFDQLTGLPNRALFTDRINHDLSMALRNDEQLSVLFLDLDHFKHINDTLGHSIGDALLIEVAKRLKAAVRDEDTVSRQGGDEFVLILPNTNADGAAHVAAKLLEKVAIPFLIEQHELVATPSIGIAMYPSNGDDFESLCKCADVAMYRAKHDGRNTFRFFTQEMQTHSARTLQLENALRHALELDQLTLHYQPQIALQDGRIIGAEVLLRWNHPELGNVSPAEFIPIAEASGQILPIGEWVLRSAVQQLKNWMDSGLAPMIIAVNLSAVQFRHPHLPELVTQILQEVKLPPKYLELELTEGVAMDDPLRAIEVMDALHERGIRMSIDDFGTGYSSLSYLKKFKVYKLKIDQSFVRDITEDPEDKAIVAAIIGMANSLGIQTIAEGVETAGQLAFLRLQGCNEVQGYYFSKSVPVDQFETYVRKNNPA